MALIANPPALLVCGVLYCFQKIIVETFYFPDHFSYSTTSLEKVFSGKKSANSLFLTTEKDWVKLFSYRKALPKFFIAQNRTQSSSHVAD